MKNVRGIVGVPAISPVLLMDSPDGRFDADHAYTPLPPTAGRRAQPEHRAEPERSEAPTERRNDRREFPGWIDRDAEPSLIHLPGAVGHGRLEEIRAGRRGRAAERPVRAERQTRREVVERSDGPGHAADRTPSG